MAITRRDHPFLRVTNPAMLQTAIRKERKRQAGLRAQTHSNGWVLMIANLCFALFHFVLWASAQDSRAFLVVSMIAGARLGWVLLREAVERLKELRIEIEEGLIVAPWDAEARERAKKIETPF